MTSLKVVVSIVSIGINQRQVSSIDVITVSSEPYYLLVILDTILGDVAGCIIEILFEKK